MKKEYKELLIEALSSMFKYGVKCVSDVKSPIIKYCTLEAITRDSKGGIYVTLADRDEDGNNLSTSYVSDFSLVKPYLREFSSMTEKEKKELLGLCDKETQIIIEQLKNDDCGIQEGKYHFNSYLEMKFVLSHRFDYLGLIPKGLAVPAKKGMYNI